VSELEAVFFDLGDTIVDLREGQDDYTARTVSRAGHVYDAIAPLVPGIPDRQEFAEKLARDTEAFYLAAVARQQGVDIYDALRHLFEEMGIPADDGSTLKAGGDAFCRGSSSLAPLRSGARDVLAALNAQGLRLGVISNTLQPGWSMDQALERRGLLHLFAARVYSSEARVAKPHAAIFRAALDAQGVAPDRAVHVGDRLVADVAGAQGVGMRAVLIEVSHRPEPDSHITPDERIRELWELPDVLTAWSR
jgi:FMN hydrolase / 5-amino-6-(5-phospho-D-ribitylamino)uracil phosphatase